jgi:hypothetical protein
MPSDVTESVKQDILCAAKKLQGFLRRQFQAQMTLKYCDGKARQAEKVFGWGRAAVNTGLNELRTGIRCRECFSMRGRPKSEKKNPELIEQIEALIEPRCQADSQLKTPLAYTRVTAKSVHSHLVAHGTDQSVPAQRTVSNILNRLGYRMRRVRKTKPKKNFPKPTPSSTISRKSTSRVKTTRKRFVSRWTPRLKSR